MKRGNVSLIFNGEIYNFKLIKEELQKLGHSFQTDSDTEVILESYLEWGSDCVARFEGMFAFVIIDEDNQTLIMCRDRFGTNHYTTIVMTKALFSQVKFNVSVHLLICRCVLLPCNNF